VTPAAKSRPKRVAIACQGGGSHTAFTAGVLERVLADQGEAFLAA
jgi:NTE family protein